MDVAGSIPTIRCTRTGPERPVLAILGIGWDIELYPGQVASAVLTGLGTAVMVPAPSEC